MTAGCCCGNQNKKLRIIFYVKFKPFDSLLLCAYFAVNKMQLKNHACSGLHDEGIIQTSRELKLIFIPKHCEVLNKY